MIILSNCHALPRCIPCFDEEQVCCTPSTHEHNPWVRTMKQRGVCCLQTLLPADPVLFVRSDSSAMRTAPPTSHDKTAHNLSGGAGDQQGEEGPRKQSPKTPPGKTTPQETRHGRGASPGVPAERQPPNPQDQTDQTVIASPVCRRQVEACHATHLL